MKLLIMQEMDIDGVVNGKVKDITESNIVIELPDGEIINHPRRTAIQSQNDIPYWDLKWSLQPKTLLV